MDRNDSESYRMDDAHRGCGRQLSGKVYCHRDCKDRKISAGKGHRPRGKCLHSRPVGALLYDEAGNRKRTSLDYRNGQPGGMGKERCAYLDGEEGNRYRCRRDRVRIHTGRRTDGRLYCRRYHRNLYCDEKRRLCIPGDGSIWQFRQDRSTCDDH